MEKIIQVRDLVKSYGSFKAVDGLNLDVYRGEVFGFLGPNGAGKSTTIRMLLSLIRPDAGSVLVFGKSMEENRREILANIGCIVEKPDFYKFLSARKNLEVLARYNGISASRNRLEELIEFVGLKGRGDDPVKGYSHGMKQRLGLAQALLHDPELIILDEPTTGLDPQGIIDIRNLILYLSREKKKTVFLSSHILHELELVADRMAILNKGKLVVQGTKAELLDDQDRVVDIQLNDVPLARRLLSESKFGSSLLSEDSDLIQLRLNLNDIPAVVSLLVEAGLRIFGVESRRRLEELFLKLTESAERMQINKQ